MAGPAYVIELDVDDAKLVKGFDRSMDAAERRADKFQDRLDRLKMPDLKTVIGGTGGVGGGTGSGSGNRGGISTAPGPYERLTQAVATKADRISKGTATLDDDYRVARAQKAVDSADRLLNPPAPRGTFDKIKDAVMTSRIGVGGGLMPLVNKLASIAGPEALAVTAGTIGALSEGLSNSKASGDAFYIGGGTGKETAAMVGLGGFFGRTPGQSAQAAESLAGRLHGGTYGAGIARGAGIVDNPANPDKATNYIKTVDMLRNIKGDDEARRVARDLGMQDELWARDLKPSGYQALQDMDAYKGTSEQRFGSANYRYAKERVGGFWDSLVNQFAAHPFEDIGELAGGIIGGLSTGGLGAVAGFAYGKGIGYTLDHLLIGDPNPDQPTRKGNTGQEPLNDPRVSPGMVGGGNRARGAVPGAWKNAQVNDALYAHAQALGGLPY